MNKEMKTVLTIESKPQADAMMTLLGTLDQNTRKSMLDFFQGVKFMQNLMGATSDRTAVRSSG